MNLYQQFLNEIEGKNSDEIIAIFEEKYAFKYGCPGTYLADLYHQEKEDSHLYMNEDK